MDPFHAVVLGALQGLTEFLPISSSGHLALAQWAFGWDDFAGDEQLGQAFDVAVHVGTLLAVVVYFRKDIARLASAGIGEVAARRPLSVDGRVAWLLVLSAVPAAIAGAVVSDTMAESGDRPVLIGVLLVLFGLVLAWADRRSGSRSAGDWTPRHAMGMGAAQALALQPGVSRSGATMTVALALGYRRSEAARLAFLMSIPVIAGAGFFEGAKVVAAGGLPSEFRAAFILGFLASAATGWLAIWGTLRIVQSGTFRPFVIYRVGLGATVIVAGLAGYR